MKTNKTTFNYATLVTLFSTTLGFNLARVKCLVLIILALVETRCVNLARIAGFCNSKTDTASRYRRVQRFIQQVQFPPSKLAPLLLHIMEIDPKKDKLCLILDRTNWKFGKTHCNILYLAVAYQGTALPLFGKFWKIRKEVTLTIMTGLNY